MLPIENYLFLSLALFIIGVIGVVTRRNVIVVLMSIELILNAVNINLVAFSRLYGDVAGQVFALFIIADAAAEAAVALGNPRHRTMQWHVVCQTVWRAVIGRLGSAARRPDGLAAS